MEEHYTNEHGQMFPLSARGMTQAMLRDTVGCLCMAAETLLADPLSGRLERTRLAELLSDANRLMTDYSGPEVLLPGQVSLTERMMGAEEMLTKLREG